MEVISVMKMSLSMEAIHLLIDIWCHAIDLVVSGYFCALRVC